jgi:hypothetical protein
MKWMRSVGLAMLCTAAPTLVLAANPELLGYEQGIEDPESESQALKLADLELDFDVVGALADVTLTARFANPIDETLEGRFNFELPTGALVTGYALDIDGVLTDGVLVDQLKARRSYEAKVREGIDPGVAKVSRGNVFSTRVFPIPGEGERTIRLRFSAPIHPVRGLEFPLDTDEKAVGKFRFTLAGTGLSKQPVLKLPNELEPEWQELDDGHRAVLSLYGKPLSGRLQIAALQPRHTALATLHANGERRAHIVDGAERVHATQQTGGRLRVYWDRSRSRLDQKLELERRMLSDYIAASKPAAIDLVLFNSSGANLRRVSAEQLKSGLDGVSYRGATSFAVLEKLAAPEADVCLLFSDGVATIDARPEFSPGCEVFALTSAADADRGYLQRLAGGSAAAVLHVGELSRDQVLARLRGASPRVIRVSTEQGRSLNFTALDAGEKGWSVIAEAPAEGAILLQIAGLRGKVEQRRYTPISARRQAFAAPGALWAASEISRLDADGGEREAFVALSRKYSVASPRMSFLVLETPEDYVHADIEPAKTNSREFREAYRELRAERARERKEMEDARLGELVEYWQEMTEWWETRFDPLAKKPEPPKKIAAAPAVAAAGAASSAHQAATVVDAISSADVGRSPGGDGEELHEISEIAVTGMRASMNHSVDAKREVARSIEVEMAEWSVQRPYIAALDAATREMVDQVIAAQEREFGTLPAFYFDVAEWLRRHGREADAEEMLLSALELAAANEQTAAMVAGRLQRYGSMDRAIWLLERAAAETDYLPQPRRSLALALARRAAGARGADARQDLERAVTLLHEVIMTPWEGDYDGIEVIALMEINELLPRARDAGVRRIPLDQRLRKLLDVDLRVVIEWNTGATDMDLWVDEPNGERSIYNNALTAIGGRLSNDMTDGFGPEEYLLRHAARGEYRISVNVYDTDVINPNGSTVVTARLFRNFGRADQSEQTMEIELVPEEKGEKLIGRFTVM